MTSSGHHDSWHIQSDIQSDIHTKPHINHSKPIDAPHATTDLRPDATAPNVAAEPSTNTCSDTSAN